MTPAQFHAPASNAKRRAAKKRTKKVAAKPEEVGGLHQPTRKGSGGWLTVL
jgi:hypothetical protein